MEGAYWHVMLPATGLGEHVYPLSATMEFIESFIERTHSGPGFRHGHTPEISHEPGILSAKMLPVNREPGTVRAYGMKHAGEVPAIDVVAHRDGSVPEQGLVAAQLFPALHLQTVAQPVDVHYEQAEQRGIHEMVEPVAETIIQIGIILVKHYFGAIVADRHYMLVGVLLRIADIAIRNVGSFRDLHLPVSDIVLSPSHISPPTVRALRNKGYRQLWSSCRWCHPPGSSPGL